jgi:cold shock CspA family protein
VLLFVGYRARFYLVDDKYPVRLHPRSVADVPAQEDLENNNELSFEVVQGTKGPEARNVSRV